jgi:hypothetical protein
VRKNRTPRSGRCGAIRNPTATIVIVLAGVNYNVLAVGVQPENDPAETDNFRPDPQNGYELHLSNSPGGLVEVLPSNPCFCSRFWGSSELMAAWAELNSVPMDRSSVSSGSASQFRQHRLKKFWI